MTHYNCCGHSISLTKPDHLTWLELPSRFLISKLRTLIFTPEPIQPDTAWWSVHQSIPWSISLDVTFVLLSPQETDGTHFQTRVQTNTCANQKRQQGTPTEEVEIRIMMQRQRHRDSIRSGRLIRKSGKNEWGNSISSLSKQNHHWHF